MEVDITDEALTEIGNLAVLAGEVGDRVARVLLRGDEQAMAQLIYYEWWPR